MLKKLVVISVIAVVLAGCEKKVTKDMLVGKWTCININYYDIENNQRDTRNNKIGPFVLTYEKNGSSMTEQFEDLAPREFTFERLIDNPYAGIDRKAEYKQTKEYVFISNDKYEYIDTSLIRDRQSKQTIELNKFITSCERIKDK